jgi:hypothetical protein
MATIQRVPVTNTVTGNDYTLRISLGAGSVPADVLLDTGSSMLVVDGGVYDPSTDHDAATTQLLQTAQFASGSFMASVIRTSVALPPAGAAPLRFPGANLAVTYDSRPGTFGRSDGIFGLAYAALDTAYRMPADTWKNRYSADQLQLGQQADLDPYFSQLAAAGLVSNKFAFAVRRSVTRQALDDPSTDPLNSGLFVLGGGAECTDLYQGPFASVAVVHEQYYNTNLVAVRVGNQTINVPPAAPGSRVASNSIVDSGSSNLTLDQGLYDKVVAAFHAIDPAFAAALLANAPTAGSGCDQTRIDLTKWPALLLILQGSDGGQATVSVAPGDYWQFDSVRQGNASAMLCGDGGMLGGQSILGLPVFSGHFVVFDRTATNGHGVIGFAVHA